jgi:hypothetical protein
MPVHHHAGCEHEHDHDEASGAILFERIDRDHVVALNEARPESGKQVIKPWDRRNDEVEYLESDADEQLIRPSLAPQPSPPSTLTCVTVRVPFTGSVKLRSVIIKGGNSRDGPVEVRLVRRGVRIDRGPR